MSVIVYWDFSQLRLKYVRRTGMGSMNVVFASQIGHAALGAFPYYRTTPLNATLYTSKFSIYPLIGNEDVFSVSANQCKSVPQTSLHVRISEIK
jgi:hypothetical protein